MGSLMTFTLFGVLNAVAYLLMLIDKRLHFLRGQQAITTMVVVGVFGGGPGMYLGARQARHFTFKLHSTLLFLAIWGVFVLHVTLRFMASGWLGYLICAALWQGLVSVFALMLVAWDKRQAQNGAGKEQRIAEADFAKLALVGGFAGVMWGFQSLRHKTKHRKLIARVTWNGFIGIAVVLGILIFPKL